MIRVVVDFICDSNDMDGSIPEFDALWGKIKYGEYNRVVVVSQVFFITFGIEFVGEVGIIALRSELFEDVKIILSKVDIRQGVDDTLFSRGVECETCDGVLQETNAGYAMD